MIRAALIALLVALTATPALAVGVLRPRAGGPPIPADSRRIRVVVEDGFARMTVTDSFRPETKKPFEALYEARLPGSALLASATVSTAGLTLVAVPARWPDVREIRDRILAEGGRPVVAAGAPRRCHRLPVSPVVPGETVEVTRSFLFEVPLRKGSFTVDVPLPPPVGCEVRPPVAVEVVIRSSLLIRTVRAGPEGFVVKRPDERTAVVAFGGLRAGPDEFVSVTAEVFSPAPLLALSTHRGPGGAGWFRAVVGAPTQAPENPLPRDVVLVLDVSASMQGERLESLKRAVRYLLERLRPVDRVNVVLFAEMVRAFAPGPIEATPANLRRLRRFVDAMEAKGGTRLGDALKQAVDVDPAPGRVRTLVLVTDGRPTKGITGTKEILTFARRGRAAGFRVHCFGIIPPWSGWLLRLIARAGGGECWFLEPGCEIRSSLTEFLERSSSPTLTDLSIDLGGAQTSEVLPLVVPEVPIGEQLVVTGRYSAGGSREVVLRGMLGVRPFEIRRTFEFKTGAGGPPGIADRHAFAKLMLLGRSREYRMRLSTEDYLRMLREHRIIWEGDVDLEMRRLVRGFGWEAPGMEYVLVLAGSRHAANGRKSLEVALAAAETARRAVLSRRDLVLPGPKAPAGSCWERFGRVDVAVGGPPHR